MEWEIIMSPTIYQLQYFQYLHDKVYHPEVNTMALHRRLTHLHQHLVKYGVTKFLLFSRIEDALICTISMANTVGLNITDGFKALGQPVYHFTDVEDKWHKDHIHSQYLSEVGKLAKALEGIDHLETTAINTAINPYLISIIAIIVQLHRQYESDPKDIMTNVIKRLMEIKRKHLFYAKLHMRDLEDESYKSMIVYTGV